MCGGILPITMRRQTEDRTLCHFLARILISYGAGFVSIVFANVSIRNSKGVSRDAGCGLLLSGGRYGCMTGLSYIYPPMVFLTAVSMLLISIRLCAVLYFLHNLSKRSRDTQCTLWLFSFSRSHLMQFLLEICRGWESISVLSFTVVTVPLRISSVSSL